VRVQQEQPGRTEFAALLVPSRGAGRGDPLLRLERQEAATDASFTLEETAWRVRFDLDDRETPVSVERSGG
jgi:hypothetical protein